MDWIKLFFKRFPRLYRAFVYIFGAQPHNTTAYQFVQRFQQGSKVLNVGSGPRKLPGAISIDVIPFEGVDIVASAESLPFETDSVDGIVCDNVLEHVEDPERVVAEFKRVLKKGGLVYIAIPFVIPYHSSPYDFRRWTTRGVRLLLRDFREVELKIQCGPSAAFTMVLSEWLALLLSFNSKVLYSVVLLAATIISAPIKLLDYLLVHYNRADISALSFYFIGAKE